MSLLDAIEAKINEVSTKPEPKVEVKEAKVEKPEPKIEVKPEVIREEEPKVEAVEDEEDIEEKALSFKETIKEVRKEAKEQPRIERIIEDGVERDITIDELKKGYQKSSVSGKRFDEASKKLKEAQTIEGQVQDFVDLLNSNPIVGLYEVLGEERTNQVLEQYRREMDEYQQMTPEAKENFLLKRRLEARDTTTKFKVEREQEVLDNNEAQYHKEDLTLKVEKVSENFGLNTNEMKIALLNKMRTYSQYKGPREKLDMSELEILAEQVRDEFGAMTRNRVKGLKGEQLIRELGNDVVDEVRKELLNQYKQQRGQKIAVAEKDVPKKTVRKFDTQEDARKFWDNPTEF